MVPGTDDQFLLIAYGLGWSEVTPENLLKCRVNKDGSFEVIAGKGSAGEKLMCIILSAPLFTQKLILLYDSCRPSLFWKEAASTDKESFADKTAAWIHSRIHAWDPHKYAVVFHTHQPWATALCCLKDPT